MNEDPATGQQRWRILVAITGTVEGQRALEQALQLARIGETEIVGLLVESRLPLGPATVAEVDDAQRHHAPLFETVGRLAIDQASEHGIDLEIRRRPGPLVRAVCREAAASNANLVIVGRPRSILALPRVAALMRRLRRPLLIAT